MFFLWKRLTELYEYMSDKVERWLDYFDSPFDVIDAMHQEQDLDEKYPT
jgi:hypothetical protein